MKPRYQLTLDKLYDPGTVLTYDPEYGDQVEVRASRENAEYPGNFIHDVKMVSNDPHHELTLGHWLEGIELIKIQSTFPGEYSTHTNLYFSTEEDTDKYHEERQTFCYLRRDITKL